MKTSITPHISFNERCHLVNGRTSQPYGGTGINRSSHCSSHQCVVHYSMLHSINTNIQTHACTQTHAFIHKHIHTQTHTYTNTYVYIHKHIHAHKHTYTRKHTYTHKHTYTQSHA